MIFRIGISKTPTVFSRVLNKSTATRKIRRRTMTLMTGAPKKSAARRQSLTKTHSTRTPKRSTAAQKTLVRPTVLNDFKWDSFSNWLMSTNTFYWISGKPGSGKTTLVKHILSSPKTKQYLDVWKTKSVIISHFSWRTGTDMQRNSKGFLLSSLPTIIGQPRSPWDYSLDCTWRTTQRLRFRLVKHRTAIDLPAGYAYL